MTLSYDAVFPQGIISSQATPSEAMGSSNTTSPSNTVPLITAGSDGAMITYIKGSAVVTHSASSLVLLSSTNGGTTKYRIKTIAIPAETISNSAPGALLDFEYSLSNPLLLKPNESLYVGVLAAITDGIHVRIEGRSMS